MDGIPLKKLTDPKRKAIASRKSKAALVAKAFCPPDPSTRIERLREHGRALCYAPLDGLVGESLGGVRSNSSAITEREASRLADLLTQQD